MEREALWVLDSLYIHRRGTVSSCWRHCDQQCSVDWRPDGQQSPKEIVSCHRSAVNPHLADVDCASWQTVEMTKIGQDGFKHTKLGRAQPEEELSVKIHVLFELFECTDVGIDWEPLAILGSALVCSIQLVVKRRA